MQAHCEHDAQLGAVYSNSGLAAAGGTSGTCAWNLRADDGKSARLGFRICFSGLGLEGVNPRTLANFQSEIP